MMVDPLIAELASRTRDLVEANVESLLFCDVDSLAGGCGFASYILARALKAKGVPANVVVGLYEDCTHAWVEVGEENDPDPVIVDITYTQFGPDNLAEYPRVHIAPSTANGYHGEYEGYSAERDLVRWGDCGPLHESTIPVVNRILSDLGAPTILDPNPLPLRNVRLSCL